jgi:hypothetical protein
MILPLKKRYNVGKAVILRSLEQMDLPLGDIMRQQLSGLVLNDKTPEYEKEKDLSKTKRFLNFHKIAYRDRSIKYKSKGKTRYFFLELLSKQEIIKGNSKMIDNYVYSEKRKRINLGNGYPSRCVIEPDRYFNKKEIQQIIDTFSEKGYYFSFDLIQEVCQAWIDGFKGMRADADKKVTLLFVESDDDGWSLQLVAIPYRNSHSTYTNKRNFYCFY